MAITLSDQECKLSARGRNALRELRKVQAELDELKIKADKYREILKSDIGEPELGSKRVGVVSGVPVCSYTVAIRRQLSSTLLRKGYPEIADECTVETRVPTFKILGEK